MTLIHLSQVKDGLLLKSELESLKANYDAAKVLTDLIKPVRITDEILSINDEGKMIVAHFPVIEDVHNIVELYLDGVRVESSQYKFDKETGEFAGEFNNGKYTVNYSYNTIDNNEFYNVNEIIKSINTVINEQLGGSGAGSIQDRIQAALVAINDKLIRDFVKLEGSLTLSTDVNNPTIQISSNIDDIEVDTTKDYILYDIETNKPLQKEDGNVLTYNFETNKLNGTLCMLDESDDNLEDGITYKPVTNSTINFKIFVVAEFAFGSLNKDYLLDNFEYNSVAYSKAIDEIVVNLRQDDNLIESIKQLVGEQSVQEQIENITKLLDERIVVVEDAINILNGTDTTEGSVDKKIKDAIDILNSTVEFNIQSKYVELYNKDQDILHEINKINAVRDITYTIEGLADNQTEFILIEQPIENHKVELYINTVYYREDKYFVVDRTNNTVTWTFTEENGGFNMESDFDVEFVYKTIDIIEDPVYLEQPTNN